MWHDLKQHDEPKLAHYDWANRIYVEDFNKILSHIKQVTEYAIFAIFATNL